MGGGAIMENQKLTDKERVEVEQALGKSIVYQTYKLALFKTIEKENPTKEEIMGGFELIFLKAYQDDEELKKDIDKILARKAYNELK